ncbi:type I phosphomannose isomerase catalytic subunit [Ruminiclostridium cellulolyticum]|uniref:Phosphohexomutase n=1 Tax=Ruminiclostridium cellulolyticum (strain ATCC 35319 / DSM 5812 / JCM 6584 / H10) TaxID=394503 RepID=B8I036_RUMCH|nr:type I phosphomannose isomerase catalytic subunit [Ruminiclostridium cellulolyticum]ACL75536.1 mannose-6-phosphate isomerase, class I [Ruminiclostridium cellulolyticum H10]
MYYPIKFRPVYKDYIWGGRYFEKLGRELPKGVVAESWEVSCHKNGLSVIANGEYAGRTLIEFIKSDTVGVLGTNFPYECSEIPLLVKLIDAHDKLSVQVHPDDCHAAVFENGFGKNEMWYIMDAKPGAKLVAGLKEDVTREKFIRAVSENRIEDCLLQVEVMPGDVISIPAGLVHAIGEGIVIAEIQQTSDITYRVFDYNRVDGNGNKRPLHLEKALDVINFNAGRRKIKYEGVKVKINDTCSKTVFLANRYFACERYDLNGGFKEKCDGSKFHIYIFMEGNGIIQTGDVKVSIKAGETVFLPAAVGEYTVSGQLKALKTYIPDLISDIVDPMRNAGCSNSEIYKVLSC